MKKILRPALVVIIMLVVAIIVILGKGKSRDDQTLLVSGNIEVTDSAMAFRIPGRLAERLVDEGDSVTTGQLLARLHDDSERIALAMAEAELALAQSALAELEAGSRPEEIDRARGRAEEARFALEELESGLRHQEIADARARHARALAAVESAKASFSLAAADEKRFRVLYETNVIGGKEYDEFKTKYDTAESALAEAKAAATSAEEQLSMAQEGARTEEIERARAQLAQAVADYDLAKKGPRQEKIDQARANASAARARVDEARQQLEYTRVIAPFSGTVLSKAAEPGEYLNPGAPVVTIGMLDTVWLRGYVNETDLGRVKLGQRAEASTDSHPDRRYPGVVSFIADEAQFTPKQVQTFDERVKLVYRIKVDIENPGHDLKPGMPADARIQLKDKGKKGSEK